MASIHLPRDEQHNASPARKPEPLTRCAKLRVACVFTPAAELSGRAREVVTVLLFR